MVPRPGKAPLTTMATGGTIDPKVMSFYDKSGTLQRKAFVSGIKNSSTEKAWNDHEDRFAAHYKNIISFDQEFKELKENETKQFSRACLGKLYLKYHDELCKFNEEFKFGIPMLKDKCRKERLKVKEDMDNEIQQLFTKWCEMFPNLKGTQLVFGILKDSKDLIKYLKFSDQYFKAKGDYARKK